MSIQDILAGGGIAVVVLTLIQIVPIKVNPWSALARAFGKAINRDVLEKLDVLESEEYETRARLDEHMRIDDERNVDMHRARILQFNDELLRGIGHTRENYIEVLEEIDFYEDYCRSHEEYKNNRAVLAIENIKRVYRKRLEKRDFLGGEITDEKSDCEAN